MADAARKAAEEALAAWDGRFRPGAVGRTLIGYADAMAHALRALLAEPPEPAPAMPEGNHDAALRAENERLRTSVRSYYNALLNYGRHWPDCATPKSGDRCDCGLSGWLTEKALERAAPAAPPEGKEAER